MQFRLIVEYDGSDFHGWQLQPDERTVQEVLESAIERLVGHRVRAAAAGRTDAGVHADGQVVCFATSKDLAPDVVRRALNANLPEDVAVRTADVVAGFLRCAAFGVEPCLHVPHMESLGALSVLAAPRLARL